LRENSIFIGKIIAAPSLVHKDLLIASNGLLFHVCRHRGVLHEGRHPVFYAESVENVFAKWEESAELTEVIACDGQDSLIIGIQALLSNLCNNLQIFLLFEQVCIFHPELLSVARTPFKLSSVNLFPELLNGAEYLLMFIEEVEKRFEHLGDILINPVLVLKFDYDAVSIDICKVLLANFDLFQAIEKHQHDSHDFLCVEIIEDLADFFDNGPVVILKILLAVLVGTQDPEHGYDVVGDLWFAEAWSLK
jgi:hypothetical protein